MVVWLKVNGDTDAFLAGEEAEVKAYSAGLFTVDHDAYLAGVTLKISNKSRCLAIGGLSLGDELQTFECLEVEAPSLQIAERLDPKGSVFAETEFTWKRLNGFRSQYIVFESREPGPHDTPAVLSEETLRNKEVAVLIRRAGVLFVATPVHPVLGLLGNIGFNFTRLEVRENVRDQSGLAVQEPVVITLAKQRVDIRIVQDGAARL